MSKSKKLSVIELNVLSGEIFERLNKEWVKEMKERVKSDEGVLKEKLKRIKELNDEVCVLNSEISKICSKYGNSLNVFLNGDEICVGGGYDINRNVYNMLVLSNIDMGEGSVDNLIESVIKRVKDKW
jgi:hypothetical protein